MFVTTKKPWNLIDAGQLPSKRNITLPPGRYEVEKVPNPLGHTGPWLVLKGTKIGMAEKAWRCFGEERFWDSQIIIEE